mmetsp:Transcript_441/g.689  ORF Transcript_441/g.689 Transcript_441/m.689 type:complete len:359 (-) Transcript_441:54-1130(-)
MQFKVGRIVFIIIIEGYFIRDFLIHQYRRFITPQTRHIANGIATTTQNERGDTLGLDVFDTGRMTLECQIEWPQSISRNAISATLQNNSTGLKDFHNLIEQRLEQIAIGIIAHATLEGSIDGKAGPFLGTRFARMARAGKEIPVLVQTQRHDTIRAIKGFFDTITVMDINVNVEDAGVDFEQFQNGQDNVIDITKTARFGLFGVMQAPTPVDGHVALSLRQLNSAIEGSTGTEGTEFEDAIKDGTIGVLAGIESLHLRVVLAQIVGTALFEKGQVFFGMKLRHFSHERWMGAEAIHFFVYIIAQYQMMGQLEAVGFHGMAGAIIKVTHFWMIEIGDSCFCHLSFVFFVFLVFLVFNMN